MLVESSLYGDVIEKPMMGDLSIFCRYTNSVRTIEMFVQSDFATVSE
jgi:hypothetical protein